MVVECFLDFFFGICQYLLLIKLESLEDRIENEYGFGYVEFLVDFIEYNILFFIVVGKQDCFFKRQFFFFDRIYMLGEYYTVVIFLIFSLL